MSLYNAYRLKERERENVYVCVDVRVCMYVWIMHVWSRKDSAHFQIHVSATASTNETNKE